MKTLIIAEKPSVAKELAGALNVPRIAQGLYENHEIVISHCVGHLVELYVPEADDRNIPLPLIPERFRLKAIPKTRDQFKAVKELMHRKDIKTVANACDAGREGEAIFRLTYELAGCEKPMERLWLQSMTTKGMQTAWSNREPGAKYNNLADASRCRAESDWLFGINGSRGCYSAVGRVMTPTLAMVVRRYLEHTQFKSSAFFEIYGTFRTGGKDYVGKWMPTGSGEEEGGNDKSRFNDIAKAQAVVDRLKGHHPSNARDESKPVKEMPPALYDLTSLQREANKALKFSAKKTLQIAQDLYEKYKATTYPRTDARALPEDYVGKCRAVVEYMKKIPSVRPHAERILDNDWVKPTKRIFNNAKISDHFAIIPTGNVPSGMDADTAKLFDMIVRRFLSVFHPESEYLETIRITTVQEECFRSRGKIMLKPGWRQVYGAGGKSDDDVSLPPIADPKGVKTVDIAVKEGKTKAPALHTEASLLSAMESAGRNIDDEDLAEAMKERGLGTPATRAATIEKLLETHGAGGKTKVPYVKRDKSNLVPTQKAIDLILYLDKTYGKLTNPIMTGEWEYGLRQMEKGEVPKKAFMLDAYREVKEMVRSMQASPKPRTGQSEALASPPVGVALATCPCCKTGQVVDSDSNYQCACGFAIPKILLGKKIMKGVAKLLCTKGKTEPIEGFLSRKSGKTFSAALKIDTASRRVEFDFKSE